MGRGDRALEGCNLKDDRGMLGLVGVGQMRPQADGLDRPVALELGGKREDGQCGFSDYFVGPGEGTAAAWCLRLWMRRIFRA